MIQRYTANCSLPSLGVWADASVAEEGKEQSSLLPPPSVVLDQRSNTSSPAVAGGGSRDEEEYRETPAEGLEEGPSPSWGSGRDSDAGTCSSPGFPLGPQALAEIGVSFSMLYPTPEAHQYSIKASLFSLPLDDVRPSSFKVVRSPPSFGSFAIFIIILRSGCAPVVSSHAHA